MGKELNNVDLESLAKVVEAAKKDRSVLRKKIGLRGEWVMDNSAGYQFRTEVSYERGRQVIEIDSPSYLGGRGNRPGPMAYCVTGVASCFVSTFASVAAVQGVKLKKLEVEAECAVNFAKTLDVAEEPIVEEVGIRLIVESDADSERLHEILKMAEERCPAIFTMTHMIPVRAEIVQN
jgi:uncharacterized OsmC-like protein